MNDQKLLEAISKLIDEKLDPICQQMVTKTDLAEVRKERATKSDLTTLATKEDIQKSRGETIEILSELMHTGYNLPDKRIQKIEEQLGINEPYKN